MLENSFNLLIFNWQFVYYLLVDWAENTIGNIFVYHFLIAAYVMQFNVIMNKAHIINIDKNLVLTDLHNWYCTTFFCTPLTVGKELSVIR